MASIIWESLVSIGGRSRENFADNGFALLFIYIDITLVEILTLHWSMERAAAVNTRQLLCKGDLDITESLHDDHHQRNLKLSNAWHRAKENRQIVYGKGIKPMH